MRDIEGFIFKSKPICNAIFPLSMFLSTLPEIVVNIVTKIYSKPYNACGIKELKLLATNIVKYGKNDKTKSDIPSIQITLVSILFTSEKIF